MTQQPVGDLSNRLMDAALAIVTEQGVEAVTIREVARRCGVSHGAPRRHYPSRAALLAEVARRGFEEVARRAGDLSAVRTPKRLEAVARSYVDFAMEQPGLFELMLRHDILEDSGQVLRSTSMPLLDAWRGAVLQAIPGATDDEATTLWATVHGVASLASRRSLKLMNERPDRLLHQAVSGLVEQVRAREASA